MKDLFIQLTLESVIQAKLGPCRGDLGDGAHVVGRAALEPRQPSPQALGGRGSRASARTRSPPFFPSSRVLCCSLERSLRKLSFRRRSLGLRSARRTRDTR